MLDQTVYLLPRNPKPNYNYLIKESHPYRSEYCAPKTAVFLSYKEQDLNKRDFFFVFSIRNDQDKEAPFSFKLFGKTNKIKVIVNFPPCPRSAGIGACDSNEQYNYMKSSR